MESAAGGGPHTGRLRRRPTFIAGQKRPGPAGGIFSGPIRLCGGGCRLGRRYGPGPGRTGKRLGGPLVLLPERGGLSGSHHPPGQPLRRGRRYGQSTRAGGGPAGSGGDEGRSRRGGGNCNRGYHYRGGRRFHCGRPEAEWIGAD